MPSKVVNTLRQYRTRMNGREDALMQEMGREWIQMESRLQANINKLAEEMTRRKLMGETISQGMIYKSERYKILQAQMQEQIKSYNQDFAVTAISNAQEDAYKLGIDSAQQALLDSFTSPLSANFNRIDISAVENLIGLAGDGAPLGKLLGDDYGPAARGIIDGLLSGVANGVGASQTAKRMVDGMSIGLDRALLIARTETNRAYRMASTEQYRSSGVTSGYKRLAAQSEACLACLLLDGQIIPVGEELSDHPNGRCTVVPIVIGVDPPEWQTGKEWLLKQPEATQRRIMGNTRFEMFKEGMDLDNFVGMKHNKIWGDSPYTIPLKNLNLSDSRILTPEQIAARKARAAKRRAIKKGLIPPTTPTPPTSGKKPLTPEQKAARKARAAARKAKKSGLAPVDDTLGKLEALTKKIKDEAKPKVSSRMMYRKIKFEDKMGKPLKGRDLTKAEKLLEGQKEMKRVAAIIDEVHRDGNLEFSSIRTVDMIDKDKNTLGMFTSNPYDPSIRSIQVNAMESDHVGMTYAHEIGHWVDCDGIPYRGSHNNFASGSIEMEDFTKALQDSPELQKLGRMFVEEEAKKHPFNLKYLEYVNRDREVFARAYAQYIATKSKDPVLLAELKRMQRSTYYPTQWSDENFEPILKEFDKLFKRLEWIE